MVVIIIIIIIIIISIIKICYAKFTMIMEA